MIDVVVPISGGKDSQSCLKLALETYQPSQIIGLFYDTKFEHPLTYAHIDFIENHYGVKIERISAGSVEEKVKKYKRFPGGGARHCTDELKIKPSKIFYRELAEQQGGFEVWLGMRAGESHERKKRYENKMSHELYDPNDVISKYPKLLGKLRIKFRLPILYWTEHQVFQYLEGELNPLYEAGFPRVGCFPCLASGDIWKEKAFKFDETGRKHFKVVEELEKTTHHSIWSSKRGAIRNNKNQSDIFTGCAICEI